MNGYTTLGTNDLERASRFYDELLATIGEKRIFDEGGFIAWGSSMEQHALAITRPFDGQRATVGNGVMLAIQLPDKDAVNAFHAKALELGASDEGTPGPRAQGFYAGYFRDLDGNKLNAFVFE